MLGGERCQAGGESESVAVELLVDVHLVTLERRVDGVTATAEVDEVQKLEVLLQLVLGDGEALDDLVSGDDGVVSFAARRQQVREQCLQDRELLRHDRSRRALAEAVLAWDRRGLG